MTIVPNQTRSGGLSSAAVRTVIFWVMVIALAIFVWNRVTKPKELPRATPLSYADFVGQVEKSNVATAKFYEARNSTEIQGQLREPADNYTATVPNEAVRDLTQRLKRQGTVLDVSEGLGANPASVTSLLINLGPLLIILLMAIFIFRVRRNQGNRSQQGTPSSGPLG